ncbi:MAG: hypothetical protein WCP28_12110 [Actinomycetes bacterium]
MAKQVVTVVDAQVDEGREADLLNGYRRMVGDDEPDGLIRSELLRGQDGAWRIQTTWRDLDAIIELRKSGKPHAASALLDGIGAQHSHAWFTVEEARAWE